MATTPFEEAIKSLGPQDGAWVLNQLHGVKIGEGEDEESASGLASTLLIGMDDWDGFEDLYENLSPSINHEFPKDV
jgi:hypothetical protein